VVSLIGLAILMHIVEEIGGRRIEGTEDKRRMKNVGPKLQFDIMDFIRPEGLKQGHQV
jgi:hypothetical protein